jgi:hypothetical protein
MLPLKDAASFAARAASSIGIGAEMLPQPTIGLPD